MRRARYLSGINFLTNIQILQQNRTQIKNILKLGKEILSRQQFRIVYFIQRLAIFMLQFELQIEIGMSIEKLKQFERNLVEQESFIKQIIEQRERTAKNQNNANNGNIDNILSSSIQKAKEKLTQNAIKAPPRHDRLSDQLATSRDKKQKHNQQSSGIAGAMKKLQQRISALEQENCRLQNQNKQYRKREMQEIQKNENMRRIQEENKRKIKNLQVSIENDKKWIKQLERKNEELQKELVTKKTQIESVDIQKKLSTAQMIHRAQEQQLKNLVIQNRQKQGRLMDLENKRREDEIRYKQQCNMLNSLNRQLQLKLSSYEEKGKQKDMLIESLKTEIKKMEAERLKISSSLNQSKMMDRSETDFYSDKAVIESRISRRKALQIENARDSQIQQLKQRNEQLVISYKNLEERSRQQKLDAKNYRNKFWQLKEGVKELIDKIHTLPNAINSQLKFLIVRINKIEAFSNQYFASTPTKSARKNSLVNNSTERSRSNSKKKGVHLDLNRSNNSVKSKKSSYTNRSTDSQKKATKSKQKQVIISQKVGKKTEILQLEGQIQQIRRRYKDLVVRENSGKDDVSEDIRQELNNLAFLLQQKSEQLTKLKKKK